MTLFEKSESYSYYFEKSERP